MNEITAHELSSMSLLRVTGADRLEFLHAQLTRDLHKLPVGQAGLAAWCNPKGRVIATFCVVRGVDSIDLLVAGDLKDVVLRRLRMFVLRAQVEISDCADTSVLGITGAHPDLALADKLRLPENDWQVEVDHATCVRLPGTTPRMLAYAAKTILQPLTEPFSTASQDHWTLLNIEARLPWVTQATTERFLPQMLDLDLDGGLDFNKGCYPGQEIIARLHYRGEVKQRLRYGICEQPLSPGDALYAPGGSRVGDVVNAARHADGHFHCLAVTNLGAERMHLGNTDGPIVEVMP